MTSYLHPLPVRIPDFFIVGGPKCGTTSLFSWLGLHPGTYLVAKEPNFLSPDIFDARHLPGAVTDWSQYLSLLIPTEAIDKKTGEATPRYLYSDVALDILAEHPSRPKVILIVRNPVDLVFSLHSQMLKQGVETEPNFMKAWRRACAAHGRATDWKGPAGGADHRLDYPLFGKLGARVLAYKKRIKPEQLRILVLEEGLTQQPEMEIASLLEFLGLPQAEIILERHNERVEIRSALLHRMLIRVRNSAVRVAARIGLDVTPSRIKGTGLLSAINKLNKVQPNNTQKLDAVSRCEVADFLAQDVRMITQALGRSTTWQDWDTQ